MLRSAGNHAARAGRAPQPPLPRLQAQGCEPPCHCTLHSKLPRAGLLLPGCLRLLSAPEPLLLPCHLCCVQACKRSRSWRCSRHKGLQCRMCHQATWPLSTLVGHTVCCVRVASIEDNCPGARTAVAATRCPVRPPSASVALAQLISGYDEPSIQRRSHRIIAGKQST